jgi:microcystin-dependent protein
MEPFIGQIIMFGGNFAPRGWALCDGQILPISLNSALFSILGTTYGGDGRTTFRLPDLRGRSPVHAGSGSGLATVRLGERGGTETQTLTTGQMPSHTHIAKGVGEAGNSNMVAGRAWSNDAGNQWAAYSNSVPDVDLHSAAIGSAGGGQPFNIRDPFQAVHFIIALVGTFPSPN